jgi:hypothetical protein
VRFDAARKLAQYDGGARVPATISAIGDAIRSAEQIMEEIDPASYETCTTAADSIG